MVMVCPLVGYFTHIAMACAEAALNLSIEVVY